MTDRMEEFEKDLKDKIYNMTIGNAQRMVVELERSEYLSEKTKEKCLYLLRDIIKNRIKKKPID